LIDEFDYPVLGPGMMYKAMGDRVKAMGGRVMLDSRVTCIRHEGFRVTSVECTDKDGKVQSYQGDEFISTIPVTELIGILEPKPPENILAACSMLNYRSIITVDIIIDRERVFPDNWIYIHSPEVKLGRIQNFKNWSADMVPDPKKTSLGLEYFCNEGDEFWNMPDEKLFELAASEVEKIRICSRSEITDYIVVRVPKAYPVYMMGYKEHLAVIEAYLRKFANLQFAGRYGLFKYNNMDHSILTGLYAAQNILDAKDGNRKFDTWTVNTDEEYHEEKKA
jgi:protoporphyrinogen oxidase